MKRIVLSVLCSLGLLYCAAQKNFTGQIDYLLVSPDSTMLIAIKTWFAGDKIKFVSEIIKAPKESDTKNETIILDFGKGVIERIKFADKKVERESITSGKGKKQDIPNLQKDDTKRSILGYDCSGYTTGTISKEEKKDSVIEKASVEVKFWYSDKLVFEVPDSLKMIQMVPLFTNGHIALGSVISINAGGLQLRLTTEAKTIKPRSRLPRSVFRHPKGYALIPKQ